MSFNSDVVFLEICQHTNNLQDFSSGMFCVSSALSSGSYTGIPWQVGLKRGEALDVEGDRIVVREEGFYFVYSQVGKVSVISFLFHTGALLFHLQMFTFFSALTCFVHLIFKSSPKPRWSFAEITVHFVKSRSITWTAPSLWAMWWSGGKLTLLEMRIQTCICFAASRPWTLSTPSTPATQEVSLCIC